MHIRIAFGLLLPALALALSGCETSTSPGRVADRTDLPADQVIQGVKNTLTRNGIREAELRGDSAYLYAGSGMLDLMGVELLFYDELGRERGRLVSETGEFDQVTGAMVARGDVVLTLYGEKEREITGEELNFNLTEDRIWSDKPVVLKEGDLTVAGEGLDADASFQNVKLRKGSTSNLPLSDDDVGITF
jgi:LPS export ABC transporter protein LptC